MIEGKSGSAISYSDDLRPQHPVRGTTRHTELRVPSGVFLGLVDYFGLFPVGREFGDLRATTRLAAPRGTQLDSSDRDFCMTPWEKDGLADLLGWRQCG